MKRIEHVGIGVYKVHRSPVVLKTVLGSCVGVFLYHSGAKLGGLAHVYLPDSKEFKSKLTSSIADRPNFADIMIPNMIKRMINYGADLLNLQGFIAGGAMLSDASHNIESLQIGKRNLEMVRIILKNHGIPFRELDVGGRFGKVLECNLETGEINLRTVKALASEESIEVQDY